MGRPRSDGGRCGGAERLGSAASPARPMSSTGAFPWVDSDYTKILFSVTVAPSVRAPDAKAAQSLVSLRDGLVQAYEKTFCPGITFLRSDNAGPALQHEAAGKNCGFVLSAVITRFVYTEDRGSIEVEWDASHQMLANCGKTWKAVFMGNPRSAVTAGVFTRGALAGAVFLDNPAEIPFFEALLPMRVTGVREVGGDVEVTATVRNLLPFPMRALTPYLIVPEERRIGPRVVTNNSYVRAKARVDVSLSPGAEQSTSAVVRSSDLKGAASGWMPRQIYARYVRLETLSSAAPAGGDRPVTKGTR